MPLNFAHTTFGQAKTLLASLLNDPTSVFYSNANVGTYSELGWYIVEALRFWGAATGYWRDQGTFNTSTATGAPPNVNPATDNPWYDLPTFLPSLRGYNVLDSDLLQQIEYALLEPGNVPYSGSSQFTQAAIVTALQRRRDQFLLETMTVLTHQQFLPSIPASRFVLPDSTMAVRRVGWYDPATLAWKHVSRSDEWFMLNYYARPWPAIQTGDPDVYSVALTPPLTMQLAPPAGATGVLDLIVVKSGAPLAPTGPGAGVLLGIPDDFTWVVKFGALADLLGEDGPAKDPKRSLYAQQRWEQGIQMAKIADSVLFLSISGNPMYAESLDSADKGRRLWQNYLGSPPFMGALVGLNLMAMIDPPTGSYPVELDVVQNAIVPVADADFLQIGREELAAVLGYAQHLAAFKCGGMEFMSTMAQYNRIMNLARTYNAKLAAMSQPALVDRAEIEKASRPAMLEVG